MLDSRSVDTPIDYHVKLDADMGKLLRMLDSINASWEAYLLYLYTTRHHIYGWSSQSVYAGP